jgi:hypothetical protein
MTSKAALRGFVTGCRGPASAPGKEGVSLLPAPTILTTEGDWP